VQGKAGAKGLTANSGGVYGSYCKSLLYLVLGGFCKIGGGYLIWILGVTGRAYIKGLSVVASVILILYSVIIPTILPLPFRNVRGNTITHL